LVRRYQGRIRAFAARFVEAADDADDLAQEAFLNAFRHLNTFDSEREFYPWVRAICRNLVRNYYRSRRARRSVALSMVDEAIESRLVAADDGDDDQAFERFQALSQCIDELQSPHRRLIDLRYNTGLAVKDIATGLNRSAASVSMMLGRLRTVLAKCAERRLEATRA
jgi:RNA polymerase sigma-70 factor (ECF subfamily)